MCEKKHRNYRHETMIKSHYPKCKSTLVKGKMKTRKGKKKLSKL